MSPPIAAGVVAAPDLGLAVVGVDAADVAPTSVALHLLAAGAGVEGVGDEAGPQEWLAWLPARPATAALS
jgi:hypothetical protein